MSHEDLLSKLFDYWRQIADETIRCLGQGRASLFIDLYNDALDIQGAILDAYSEEERLRSLMFADFTGLLKELHWLHAIFLFGNYPFVVSRLRHDWEWLFRAYHADTYAQHNPSASDAPELTLDDKNAWLMQQETRLNWNTLIAPTLARLFPADAPEARHEHFRPLWDRLNRMVHPSGELRLMLVDESALLVRDAFDERWARETLADAAEVFALIWLAILSRFPAAVPALVADPHTFRSCRQLRAVLEGTVPPE
jgi:hypothetical protein